MVALILVSSIVQRTNASLRCARPQWPTAPGESVLVFAVWLSSREAHILSFCDSPFQLTIAFALIGRTVCCATTRRRWPSSSLAITARTTAVCLRCSCLMCYAAMAFVTVVACLGLFDRMSLRCCGCLALRRFSASSWLVVAFAQFTI